MMNKFSWKFKVLISGLGFLSTATSLALTNLTAGTDATNVSYSYSYSGAPSYLRIFLDTDQNKASGYSYLGIGADYLIENGNLYKYSGTGGSSWAWASAGKSNMVNAAPTASWSVPRIALGSPAAIYLVASTSSGDSSSIVTQTLGSATVTWSQCAIEGGSCNYTGTKTIRYGANGVYTTKTLAGPVNCTNAVFGDPVYGVTKYCETSSQAVSSTTPTPTPTPTAPPPASTFVKPTLVNPVSPVQYGAKCDGVTDDSAAFQAAINASDVLVPAKTCVINKTVFVQMSHRHIECSAGAILLHTNPYAGRMIHIIPSSGSITDDSIVNCYFKGTNTVAPQYYNNDNRHWDIPVQASNIVNNLLIAGNTFDRFFGQSMFQTYAATADQTGAGYEIVYNNFKSCGYYGPVFTGTAHGHMAYNTIVDCAAGIENDNSLQAAGYNIFEYNTLTAVFGYGAPDMSSGVMFTAGTDAGADYSTNIARYNTVSGVSLTSGFNGMAYPSRIIEWRNNGGKPAQYIGNICNNGCQDVHY